MCSASTRNVGVNAGDCDLALAVNTFRLLRAWFVGMRAYLRRVLTTACLLVPASILLHFIPREDTVVWREGDAAKLFHELYHAQPGGGSTVFHADAAAPPPPPERSPRLDAGERPDQRGARRQRRREQRASTAITLQRRAAAASADCADWEGVP